MKGTVRDEEMKSSKGQLTVLECGIIEDALVDEDLQSRLEGR